MVEAVGNTVYTNVFKIKSRRIILHGMRAYDGNFVRRVSRRSMNSSTVCVSPAQVGPGQLSRAKLLVKAQSAQLHWKTLEALDSQRALLDERMRALLQGVPEAGKLPSVRALIQELKARPSPVATWRRPPPSAEPLTLSPQALEWFSSSVIVSTLCGLSGEPSAATSNAGRGRKRKQPKTSQSKKKVAQLEGKAEDVREAAVSQAKVNLRNFRDLASASPSTLRPYRVFRCANPMQCEDDLARTLRNLLGIRVALDLRALDEIEDGDLDGLLLKGATTIEYLRHMYQTDTWERQLESALTTTQSHAEGCARINVSILKANQFYERLKEKMPPKWQFESTILEWFNPKAGNKMFMNAVNDGGLWLLNEIILDISGPEIAASMYVIARTVKANIPIVLYCRAGKDRTGILSALTLYCCDVPEDQIVLDYTMSAAQKSQLGKGAMPKGLEEKNFKGAPADVMHRTFRYLEDTWGSPGEYLDVHGFTFDMQAELRNDLKAHSNADT